jgi:hypothetical protein
MRKIRILVAVGLLLVLLCNTGCGAGNDFNARLNTVVSPYRFSIARWEFNTWFTQFKQLFGKHAKITGTDTEITDHYIALSNQINDLKSSINDANRTTVQAQIDTLQQQQNSITGTVENIIKRQTAQVLKEMGIYEPWYKYIKWKFTFPPPEFKLQTPPQLLVISPREKIERQKDVLLAENLSAADATSIEDNVDKLNVSALVVGLGGIATYPDIVASDSDFQYIIQTCAHEWAHAYLAFTTLGFRYVLNIAGLTHNTDITTMNETVADIIGKEVGATVLKKYYPQFQTDTRTAPTVSQTTVTPPAFDFNKEMRAVRVQVDAYLAAGQIDIAEQYMQQKRDFFNANGYYIRKLNQAYFAFYGTYADSPGYENPIGTKITQLRAKEVSLQKFLNTVSGMTGVKNLDAALK